MTIFYELDDALYVNVTNQCPCSCVFCIRSHSDVVQNSGNMWFEQEEPTLEEIKADFERFDIKKYKEVVFCGYGEPLERPDIVRETAAYIKSKCDKPIRINTNGLGDLITGKEHTALLLKGLIDTVSISLNAPNAKRFAEITGSKYGEKSFDALLAFAEDAKKAVKKVVFTVVDVISAEEIEQCRKISDKMNIELRVRTYIDTY